MRNFDLVTVLLALAGKVHARRVAKAVQREANLKAAIQAATEGYQAAIQARVDLKYRDLTVRVK